MAAGYVTSRKKVFVVVLGVCVVVAVINILTLFDSTTSKRVVRNRVSPSPYVHPSLSKPPGLQLTHTVQKKERNILSTGRKGNGVFVTPEKIESLHNRSRALNDELDTTGVKVNFSTQTDEPDPATDYPSTSTQGYELGEENSDNDNSAEPGQNRSDHHGRKYLIYYCPRTADCGGLADRWKGIVLGYLLANVTGRMFGIAMEMPGCQLSELLGEHEVHWDVDMDQMTRDGWLFTSYLRVNALTKLSEDLRDLDYREVFGQAEAVLFRTNLDRLKHLWLNPHHRQELQWQQPFVRSAVYRAVLTRLFILAPPLQALVDEVLTTARAQSSASQDTRLVCAQIRTGRNPSNPKDTTVRVTSSHLPIIWDFMNRSWATQSRPLFFVSTDSQDVLDLARRQFGSRLLQVPGTIAHVAKPKEQSDVCPGMRRVLVDMYVLTSCDVLLLTKSGVGDLAADLRATDKGLFCLDLSHGQVRPCSIETL